MSSEDEEDEEEDEEEKKEHHHHHHHHKGDLNQEMDYEKQSNGEMNSDEIEERKKNFLRTIKNKSGWSITLNIIVGLVFSGYFIQMNLMHNRFELGI